MPKFSLATLQTPDGPKAAVVVDARYFILGQVQPVLAGLTCLDLLRSWDSAFPMLQDVVAHMQADGPGEVPAADAHVLTPVLYPDKLMAVGANYSGHLKEMGLKAGEVGFHAVLHPPTQDDARRTRGRR